MYTPTVEKELWEKRNEYFTEGKLYICKENIQCEKGVFQKGSLVKVTVCGSDGDGTLSCNNTVYTISELFLNFKKVFLRICDMDEFYDNYGKKNEDEIVEYPTNSDVFELTIDNIDEMYEKFEHQKDLEHSINEQNYISDKYFDKSEQCGSIAFILSTAGLLLFIAVSIIFIKTKFNIMWIFSLVTFIGWIAATMVCAYLSDKYNDKACTDKHKLIYSCYTEWKNSKQNSCTKIS